MTESEKMKYAMAFGEIIAARRILMTVDLPESFSKRLELAKQLLTLTEEEIHVKLVTDALKGKL